MARAKAKRGWPGIDEGEDIAAYSVADALDGIHTARGTAGARVVFTSLGFR
jgi:hypothetical protein